MDEKTWISLGSIALGGIGKLGIEWYKKRNSDKDDDILIVSGRIQYEIKNFSDNNKVDRFLILRVPVSKKNRKLRVVFEHTRIKSVYNLYQDFKPDDGYFEDLDKAIESGFLIKAIKDINSTVLADFYKSENIINNHIFIIHKTRKYIYYGSCVSKKSDFEDFMFKVNFNSLLSFLVSKFKKYAK